MYSRCQALFSAYVEQNYGGVDGDSATGAELYALLSSLSKIPLKQSIAVTGSMNQKGEIQVVGGITEKIEGFYSACKQQGLNDNQGVMGCIQLAVDALNA